MSVEAMSWVWKQELPPNGRLVLLAIADHADDNGGNAFPSQSTLARKTGYGERQIKNILDALVRTGVLTVSRCHIPNRPAHRQPNLYQINMSQPMSVSKAEFTTAGPSEELRQDVIEAFGMTCWWCKRRGGAMDPDGFPWEMDRVVAGRDGGAYVRDNVVLSCRHDNKRRWGENISPSGEEKSALARGEIAAPDEGQSSSAEPSVNHPVEPSADVSLTLDVAVAAQPSSFERFYAAYPRKAGKPAAARAFRAAVREDGLDAIRAGFKVWSAHWTENAVSLGLIPHPATWLNQKRYNDIPVAPDEKPGNGRRPDAAVAIAQTRASHDAEREEFAALMLRGALARCPDHLWPGYPDEARMAMFLSNYGLWDLALAHGVVREAFEETWGRHFDIRSWSP